MYKISKKMFFGLVLSVFLFSSLTFAEDNSLSDKVNEQDGIKQELQLNFKTFSSCESMDSILSGFLKNFPKRSHPRYYLRGVVDEVVPLGAKPMMEKTMAVDGDTAINNIQSSNTDFSTTNLQKENVDEPEILKTNGEYLFYFNRKKRKVYILKSPLDLTNSKISLKDVKIINSINIPKTFNGTKLFINKNKLIIVASRYKRFVEHETILNRFDRTSVAIFDVKNPENLKLLKFTDIDGRFIDSRMIGDNLFVISNVNINRRYRADSIRNNTIKKNKRITPSAYDVVINGQKNTKKRVFSSCDEISYLLPDSKTIKQLNLNPNFTIISVIDVQDISKETKTNVILAGNGQIHMSKDSIYFTNNIRTYNNYRCPPGAMCIMPQFNEGAQTLIHKFSIQDRQLQYQSSNLVRGSFLNQYSMDEDKNGNFRILTKQNRREGTNLYILNKDLKLEGKLEGIQSNEQFKSSRYIGDKLYLVTFRQTDPLFIIDLKKITDPKIVGELKIPGFSTYLHPLLSDGSKQYLIGLGYSVNEKGRIKGLQLSLYEVDYDKNETEISKCSGLNSEKYQDEYNKCLENVNTGNIYISMLDSKSLGGIGSWSEAMNNPRMFVIDKNNIATIPMLLQEQIKNGERCNVYRDVNGVETKSNCYPVLKQQTIFAGLKSFKFDIAKGISEEYSIDYLPLYKKLYSFDNNYENIQSRQIRNGMMRVGYLGDSIYMINNDFAHFSVPGYKDNKYIYFNEKLNN